MKIKENAKRKLKHNTRWQALLLLVKIEHDGEYSNVLVNRFLQETTLPSRDQRLLVQLVYGTIQHQYLLDAQLNPFINTKKVEPWVQTLLRMTVYQLTALDRIPAHAAINEAVQIAKVNGHQGLGNFVNGVLRQFQRNKRLDIATIENQEERLSIQYSIQPWIIHLLNQQYSSEIVQELLASLNQRPRLTARFTRNLENYPATFKELEQAGANIKSGHLSPYAIESLDGQIMHTQAFANGDLTIQDESSMLVAPLGQLIPGQSVLDMCAAPGGKATHIVQLLQQGSFTALDLSAAKLEKVKEHFKRMGFNQQDMLTTHFYATDASQFIPENGTLYDVIYVDAPCSGLGLMRRKPEIKYQKHATDIGALQTIQRAIMRRASQLLKPGGTLVYSTCTLANAENQALVADILATDSSLIFDPIQPSELPNTNILTPEGMVQVLPHQYQTDGFFIARMKKIASVKEGDL